MGDTGASYAKRDALSGSCRLGEKPDDMASAEALEAGRPLRTATPGAGEPE